MVEIKDGDTKLKASASATGGSIEVSGSAAERLAHQLADLLSPFSEVAGLAGDAVRTWRPSNVTRILKNAHDKAAARGLRIEPVHPKMLSYWVEKASLEDDDELADRWAELLLNSMGKFDTTHIWAADILVKLDHSSAKSIDLLYNNYRESGYFRQDINNINQNHLVYSAITSELYKDTLDKYPYQLIIDTDGDNEGIEKMLSNIGFAVATMATSKKIKGHLETNNETRVLPLAESTHYFILESFGLLERKFVEVKDFEISYLQLSLLSFYFFASVLKQ